MSNIGQTPVFARFLAVRWTFKTSAFNRSAISPEDKTSISYYIRDFRQSQHPKWGFGELGGVFSGVSGGFGRFLGKNGRAESLILDQTYGEKWAEKQRYFA